MDRPQLNTKLGWRRGGKEGKKLHAPLNSFMCDVALSSMAMLTLTTRTRRQIDHSATAASMKSHRSGPTRARVVRLGPRCTSFSLRVSWASSLKYVVDQREPQKRENKTQRKTCLGDIICWRHALLECCFVERPATTIVATSDSGACAPRSLRPDNARVPITIAFSQKKTIKKPKCTRTKFSLPSSLVSMNRKAD